MALESGRYAGSVKTANLPDLLELKDCWITAKGNREGNIFADTMASAHTEEQKESLQRYFLTVECHGGVYIGEHQDDTHTLHRRKQAVSRDPGWYRRAS